MTDERPLRRRRTWRIGPGAVDARQDRPCSTRPEAAAPCSRRQEHLWRAADRAEARHARRTRPHAQRTPTDPRLEMRPERAGSSPDCLTRGSSPRYASSLRLVRNRSALPTAAMNEAAQIRLTPGTLISRRISDQQSACCAISLSTAGGRAKRPGSKPSSKRPTRLRSPKKALMPESHDRPISTIAPARCVYRRGYRTCWIATLRTKKDEADRFHVARVRRRPR
jgi:hypothetical protein